MSKAKVYTVIGMMSGTSMDGVDAALITTDGETVYDRLAFDSVAYPPALRARVQAILNQEQDIDGARAEAAHLLTQAHANLVHKMAGNGPVDLIGFHGQSILHRPDQGRTLQIGNARLLANVTGIPVVHDFRSNDMKHGGQGAPLIPVYHRALVRSNTDIPRPVALVNLGGVGNVTYIGRAPGLDDEALIAFDTGPGNALIDDWVRSRTSHSYDAGGALGLKGMIHDGMLEEWMAHPYFDSAPPKSLDRNDFAHCRPEGLSLEDGAATLAAFTARSVLASARHFPEPPDLWIIAGGGRHNQAIMHELQRGVNAPVQSSDCYTLDGDAIEAEGFALMAVRSTLGLPLSFPSTTGVIRPMTGGTTIKPDQKT